MMKLGAIINEIEHINGQFTEQPIARRETLKELFKMGGRLTAAAIPVGLTSLFNQAYGQEAPSTVQEILNSALFFEYLEEEFYATGLGVSGLIPAGSDRQALEKILGHEGKHVAYLKRTIGSEAIEKPKFDFTAQNVFPNVFSEYTTFLSVAQVLEDTGVRAYKGQLEGLINDRNVLVAVLGIHATEARHAAHLRLMRRATGGVATNLKPWVVGANDTGIGLVVNPLYAGEDTKTQAGIDLTRIDGIGGKLSSNAASAAFDELLTSEQVMEIMQPFMENA